MVNKAEIMKSAVKVLVEFAKKNSNILIKNIVDYLNEYGKEKRHWKEKDVHTYRKKMEDGKLQPDEINMFSWAHGVAPYALWRSVERKLHHKDNKHKIIKFDRDTFEPPNIEIYERHDSPTTKYLHAVPDSDYCDIYLQDYAKHQNSGNFHSRINHFETVILTKDI